MLYLERKQQPQQPQQQQRHGIPLCKAELKIKVILCMFQNKINIFKKAMMLKGNRKNINIWKGKL